MLNELIKISNILDNRGLFKEADTIDSVLKSVMKMIEDKDIKLSETDEGTEFQFDLFIDENGEIVGAEPVDGDTAPSEENSDGEQISIGDYTSRNIDICPGAQNAFKNLLDQDMDEDCLKIAERALEATDELFEIEKNVINNDGSFAVYKDDLLNSFALAREISYLSGVLSEKIKKDIYQDFDFTDRHLDQISIAILNK